MMYFCKLYIFIFLLFGLYGCGSENEKVKTDKEILSDWITLALHLTKTTPANTPTFASRCFGYIGLTMYESMVPFYEDYQSLLSGFMQIDALPKATNDNKNVSMVAAVSAQAEILRLLFDHTSSENKAKINQLERLSLQILKARDASFLTVSSSKEQGKEIARMIFEWSKTDGGHKGFLKNFDHNYITKDCISCWQPALYSQSFSHQPLHPYWGGNRTFAPQNDSLDIPIMIPFDTASSSAYYQEMYEVYEKTKILTQEEKQIAIWWSDDPDSTYTPGGHSIYLMNKIIKESDIEPIKASQLYAALGMALSDAYVVCWKWKYHNFSMRPNAYINKYIDKTWESFWPDPPFPAFPSGHAIQAGATAKVLEYFFNETYSFEDDCHDGRHPDEMRQVNFQKRKYSSFGEMAEECAMSRFLGGIHTNQDNKVGLEQGAIVSENIIRLNWRK